MTGVPFVDGLSEPEAVARQDLVVLLLEAAAGGAALLAARRPRPDRSSLWSPAWVLVTVAVLIGFSAPHDHLEDADLAGPAEQATAHHGAEVQAPATDPIFKGADTSKASAAHLEAARRLILETRGATRHLTDEASVGRAGYRSIGDGGAVGSFEHFVNAAYLADGRELDPERIESVVLERTPSGKRIVPAMYILTPGKNLADAPDTAGQTTKWHDHKDLCWDPTRLRLAGRLVNGRCRPGGTFVPSCPRHRCSTSGCRT